MAMASPTVHIIDDDAQLGRALTRLLRARGYEAQSYTHPAQFLSHRPPSDGPECLLLDLKMPEMTGLDLQEILTRGMKDLPVIFMSGQADIQSSIRAMKAGAVDFLLKPFDDYQLLAAVRSALSVSDEVLSKREGSKKDEIAFVSLSPREKQVCLRIVQGLLNKQVGYELGTSEKTVKIQRARIMQKLGAGSLPDIVRLVERLRTAGVIPFDPSQPRLH
jgi:FixJ family two-component response regulator